MGEQKRIFRMLPGLENAEFERYGRMHRNTYINAPLILNEYFQSKTDDRIYFAGQISGVEGYVESVGSGLFCGISRHGRVLGQPLVRLPGATASGSLLAYIAQPTGGISAPANSPSAFCRTTGRIRKTKRKKRN